MYLWFFSVSIPVRFPFTYQFLLNHRTRYQITPPEDRGLTTLNSPHSASALRSSVAAEPPYLPIPNRRDCYENTHHLSLPMMGVKSWKSLLKRRQLLVDGGGSGGKMKPLLGIVCTVMLFIVYRTTSYQYRQTEMDEKFNPFFNSKDMGVDSDSLSSLPRGIIQAGSDLELKPLWSTSSSKSKADVSGSHNLLALPVGIKQKRNVDTIVRKFLAHNFTITLFHYDGNVDGWWDLPWSQKATHIVAHNQTKWWFAKRFLHPAVVSLYDYIFLWDEDLGVENFHPGRYLKIVKSEGLEISQPALDPNSTGIHHRITVRVRSNRLHRRVWDARGSTKCTEDSEGPPCTGFVEGMAPVFSRAAWHCAWHLIQNDLVHGWGMDMKLGYCAQGERSKKVGIVDSEYIVHQGIPTLGGASAKRRTKNEESIKKNGVDMRVEIRRQSTSELLKFKERWEKAVKEDSSWVDPFRKGRWLDPFIRKQRRNLRENERIPK